MTGAERTGAETTREIRVDGDRWKIRLGRHPASPGRRTLLFFPVTTSQRPYRVLEVPEDRFRDESDLDALSQRELVELYRESGSMDFPRSYPSYT